MTLIEEAWNSYPHCVTVIVNGYLAKHKFYICIESMHRADRGDSENALGMTNNELSQRKVEVYGPAVETLPVFRCCSTNVDWLLQAGHCHSVAQEVAAGGLRPRDGEALCLMFENGRSIFF